MHQILLRVLLLVVFFNTTVGAPLHAAEHLHGDATAPVQASVGSGFDQRADADGCVTDEHGTADGQCIWCSSYAQLATALGGGDVVALPARAIASGFKPATAAAFVPQSRRWHFAARDPPSLS